MMKTNYSDYARGSVRETPCARGCWSFHNTKNHCSQDGTYFANCTTLQPKNVQAKHRIPSQ